MNKIRCIIGTVRSGKTSELIGAFVTETTDDKLYRSVFITCEETVEAIKNKAAKIDSLRSFGNIKDKIYNIRECDSKDKLETIIAEEVMKGDCRFYIDMPELHIKHFAITANTLVDTVPNEDCEYEMDIMWTRSKNNKMRSKGGPF